MACAPNAGPSEGRRPRSPVPRFRSLPGRGLALDSSAFPVPAPDMQQTLQALLGLQEIDSERYRVEAELGRLPRERERRLEDLRRQEEAIAAAREGLVAQRGRIGELEAEILTARQRIRRLEQEVAASRDMAVIEGCRYEMRELRRKIDTAEREALELMEGGEGLEQNLERMKQALAADRAVFEEFSASVDEEIRQAQARRDELVARRGQHLGTGLDPAALSLYARLLDAREGQALATLEGRICQACYMEVPPNLFVRLARGTEVVQCPSCDRILVLGR